MSRLVVIIFCRTDIVSATDWRMQVGKKQHREGPSRDQAVLGWYETAHISRVAEKKRETRSLVGDGVRNERAVDAHSMRFRKAGNGMPFNYFLEQGLFRFLNDPLQAVPGAAISDLLARCLQDRAHFPVPGHPAMEVVDGNEGDERRGHDRQRYGQEMEDPLDRKSTR